MQLNFKEVGSGNQAIIILHGLFGSSDNWLTFSKLLANDYKIFLIDQRNHGKSPWDDSFTYTDMALDLLEFITNNRIESPIVVGHSMGGKAAMKFASLYPDLIKKLVVVDIGPKYYKPHHQKYLAGLNNLNLNEIQNRTEADAEMLKFIPETEIRQFLLKNLYRNEENKFAWRMNLSVIDRDIENIGEGLDANNKFRKPTLFVRGAKSDYINEDDLIMIKWIFPNNKVETVENAGHWVQADQPQILADLLLKFFED